MPYILMALITIITVSLTPFWRKTKATAKIGMISWILTSTYFIFEYVVIRGTTAPYQVLHQPMSDLGVTICGTDTYALASYEICSPNHLFMNWIFTLTGLVIFVGAVCLHQFWPKKKTNVIATVLLAIFGLSYTISGIIPADVSFIWHTLASLPGMFVQIPAMVIIGLSIRKEMPKLAVWTYVCTAINIITLLLIFLQFSMIDLPGGLFQRILYGSVYLWMTGTAIGLWKK
ncbi:DUF998 domain-containing protein [Evansella halocellulosilytica]|uniref:DUF998 domain-containing protein n=1 Tax=Evansella halocellulosilytica TaxID=2011013 RepID=UPI000BB74860|nr:DUF998 domain-containing protein [Evansella halocellulosilytica]